MSSNIFVKTFGRIYNGQYIYNHVLSTKQGVCHVCDNSL